MQRNWYSISAQRLKLVWSRCNVWLLLLSHVATMFLQLMSLKSMLSIFSRLSTAFCIESVRALYRPPISISPVHIADFEHQAAIQRLTVGMLFITFKSQCQIHYRLLYILCNYPKVQQLINTQFIAQCSLFFSPLLHSFAGNANLHDTMLLTVVHVESSWDDMKTRLFRYTRVLSPFCVLFSTGILFTCIVTVSFGTFFHFFFDWSFALHVSWFHYRTHCHFIYGHEL